MAYYEHLPICREAMEGAVYFENTLRHFSRYHKLLEVMIMNNKCFVIKTACLVTAMLFLFFTAAYAGNIDPDNDSSQWAWGENVGWFNFEPSEGIGVTAGDDYVAGYVWAENIGWINLSPDVENGGVTNDGYGELGGYAWGENVGWISFSCENTASCGTVDYGVTIDIDGNFNGWAWGENIGWINFDLTTQPDYKVQTSWEAGGTLITLASFTARPGSYQVTLKWKTASEIDNAGFNIYRSDSENGDYEQINDSLIPAEGSVTEGAVYEFVDEDVENRQVYRYMLEDIDLNGVSTIHGPVSATPRLIYGLGK